MPEKPIQLWKKGDSFSASHMNQSVAVARQLGTLLSQKGLRIQQTPDGTDISLAPSYTGLVFRLGVITNHGPGGAADYSDGRYYVKPIYVDGNNPTALPTVRISVGVKDSSGAYIETYPLTAVYLSEALNGGHNLPTDETQVVLLTQVSNTGGKPVWILVPLAASIVKYLKLTADWPGPSSNGGNVVIGNLCKADGSSPGSNVLSINIVTPTPASGDASSSLQFSPLLTNDVIAWIGTGSIDGSNVAGIALPTRQIPLFASNRTYLSSISSGTARRLVEDYVRGVSL